MSVMYGILLVLSGNAYEDFFSQGNVAYEENRIDDAIQAYEQLVSSGIEHAPTYYNLGNAYFYQADIGHAVLNYERALHCDPGYLPAERSLQFLAASLTRPLKLPDQFRSPWGRNSWWVKAMFPALLLVLWWCLWGILLSAVWNRNFHVWRPTLGCIGGLVILSASMFFMAQRPEAGVVVETSPLRYGPDERDSTRRELYAGDRVCVESVDGAWVRVATDSGARGWMARSDIQAVKPPFRRE